MHRPRHVRVLTNGLLAAIAALAITLALACQPGSSNPTSPSGEDLIGLSNPFEELTNNPPTPRTPEPTSPQPKQAEGELIIDGLYAQCIQSTNYDRDYLSVWRVNDQGSQTLVNLYKNHEGAVPCGFKIQVDCTVRDPHPVHGQLSAYNLYDFFIGTLACAPPTNQPKCVGESCEPPICNPPLQSLFSTSCEWNFDTCEFDCEPEECLEPDSNDNNSNDECSWNPETCEFDCEPECEEEWVLTGEEEFFEGECEDRVHVLIQEYTNSCTEDTAEEEYFTPVPEECDEPECDTPGTAGPFPKQGNPTAECSYFGDFVPSDNPDFYICKAGQDMYTNNNDVWDDECPNGKDISHVTGCACEVD